MLLTVTSKSKNIILGLKIKRVDYNKPNYMGHPNSCNRETVLCGETSQPHTIQIIRCIPVAVDIALYSRSMRHHYSWHIPYIPKYMTIPPS
jgi:hypothetical protein